MKNVYNFFIFLKVLFLFGEFKILQHLQPFWEQHWAPHHPTQKRSRLMAVNHCARKGRIRRGGQDEGCGGRDERRQVQTDGCRHR